MRLFSIKRGINNTKISVLGIKFSKKHDCQEVIGDNYVGGLAELRKKFRKQKIKVGFLVSEQAKWQYQSVYEEFKNDEWFEPEVLVVELIDAHKGKKQFSKTIEDCYNFFESKNLNVRYAYSRQEKRYLNADEMDVDILFYQQPWEIDDAQHPLNVSKRALTCYVPYGMAIVMFGGSYTNNFHQFLWKMFPENEQVINEYAKVVKHKVINCVAAGYPKLDAYFDSEGEDVFKNGKPTVIYAPHHSFEDDSLACATFQFNGLDILKMAKKYQDKVNWIFKPHPRFKNAVVKNRLMSEAEIDGYYREWENIGKVYESGDYIGIFKSSAALITDCCSFLGEYLPSSNPIFHLKRQDAFFSDWVKSILDTYYQINDMAALEQEFERVVIQKDDYKKEQRLDKQGLLFNKDSKSARKIVDAITASLEENIIMENQRTSAASGGGSACLNFETCGDNVSIISKKIKNFREKIFSIQEPSKTHNKITILGLKFKYPKKEFIELQKNSPFYIYKKNNADITKLPKATGKIRDIQLANLAILKYFDVFCRENNLVYFLFAGSALGQVRHKGFIPWDDDIDIAMMRDDYERVLEIFNQKNSPFYAEHFFSQISRSYIIKIKHKASQRFFVDIFALDITGRVYTHKEQAIYTQKIKKSREIYTLYNKQGRHVLTELLDIRKDYVDFDAPKENTDILLGVEWNHSEPNWFLKYDTVFPIKETEFEGMTFKSMANPEQYLKDYYGDYMAYPKTWTWGHSMFDDFTEEDYRIMDELKGML